jgi:hypothetical protein
VSGAPQLPTEAILALQEGNKIQAIKLTREALGIGLKESVLAVDRCLATDASIKLQFDEAQLKQRRNSGSLMTLIWLVVIALLAYFVLKDR